MRYQACKLLTRKLKREVIGKAPAVALYGFIKSKGGHAIESSQVAVQNYLLSANREYQQFNFTRVVFYRLCCHAWSLALLRVKAPPRNRLARRLGGFRKGQGVMPGNIDENPVIETEVHSL